MSGWQICRIADLGRIVTGKTPASNRPELLGDGTAFVTPTDISEQSIYAEPQRRLSPLGDADFRRTILPPNAVCFTCIASIGKMCLTKEPTLTNQQINSLIVDSSRLNPRWAFYALKAKRQEIAAIASGAATPIINKSSFGNIHLSVPPLETQRRIASILGAYDDLIEVNRRRIAVLEEMARGLFEEFAREADERSLLFDVAKVSYGKNLPKSQLIEHGPYPVYGASKIIGRYSSYTHRKRTILLGCRGTVGEFQISQPNSFITNNSFSIEPKDDVDFPWLFFALKKRGVADTVSGSAQPQITLQGASRVEVLYPSADQRARFHSTVFPILELSWGLSNANEKFVASRDLLLPRLISGQLSVADATRELKEVA